LRETDLPLLRGGKIPPAALPWLAEVERVFPGATNDIVIVRHKPVSSSFARDEAGDTKARGCSEDERGIKTAT
jgi:hypothetical protein